MCDINSTEGVKVNQRIGSNYLGDMGFRPRSKALNHITFKKIYPLDFSKRAHILTNINGLPQLEIRKSLYGVSWG